MASVRERTSKRGQTTYQVQFREGGRQSSETFRTRKGAEDFAVLQPLLGRKKALAELEAQHGSGFTVDQLAERFFAHLDVTPRTLADYRRDYANWIKPTLGHRQAATIDELDVQALVDGMKTKLDPKTVRDRHVLLSSMYRWGSARARGLVDHNPCEETQLPKVRKKPPRGMTLPEWHAFYATARSTDPDLADMALFLVATGWRWSEAAALTWANVADYGDEVFVSVRQVVRRRPGKVGAIVEGAKNDGSVRTSRVRGQVVTMLRRRQVGQPVTGFVFTNAHGRRWHQSNFLERHWRPVVEAVFGESERRPTPHWLRHTHAFGLDRSKASMAEMSRRLGHSNIQTTVNVYGGLIGDVDAEVLDRLDAMLTPPDSVAGTAELP